MGVLLQVLLAGLSTGAVIGLVAMGFTLIAGTVRVLDLAHGDVMVVAVFVGVLAVIGRVPVAVGLGTLSSIGLVAVVLAAAAAFSVLVGLLLIGPRLGRSGTVGDPLGWVAAGVAAGLLLRAAAGQVFTREAYAIPDPLHLSSLSSTGLLDLPGGASLPVRTPVVLALAVVLALVTERVVVRSRLGLGLRAVADDPAAAALCGVDVRRLVLSAFLVAGLLAGAAGLLDAPGRSVSVDDGVVLSLEAIAAAMVGGLGSLRGAVAGGLAIGLAQALAVHAGGAGLQDVAPLALLVVLLAWRPQGLRA